MAWPTELYYDFLITGAQHEISHGNGTTGGQPTNPGMISLNFISDHGTPDRVVWISRISTLSIDGPRPTRQFDTKCPLLNYHQLKTSGLAQLGVDG